MKSLKDIRCFLLDMDGTFYLGNKILPGALEFMDVLRQTGRDYMFLTNNSSRDADYYAAKLAKMGWQASKQDILTSGEATAIYISRQKPGAKIFLLGTPELIKEFQAYGFTLTSDCPDFVVLGFDMTLDYAKLVIACNLIRSGVPFIASHPDINCPTETGYIPDCGAMISLITASTGITPHIIGKPNRDIIDVIFDKKSYQPQQMAMVGDRLYTDIATGRNAGITSILVLSGETVIGDVDKSEVKPDYTFENLGTLAQALRR